MLARYNGFETWPDWVKMLLLVGMTVVTMAGTVIILSWLLDLIV